MKNPISFVNLVDLSASAARPDPQLVPVLRRAHSTARGRKQTRTPVANRMVAKGHADYRRPHPESWRFLMARYLRRVLARGAYTIHTGGHHLAIHERDELAAGTRGVCLALLVEAKPL